MGLVARKPAFGVSHKASFKPVSSATETSLKIEILICSKFSYDTFNKANNKGADQTAWMRRLVCACVVRKPPKTGFLALRPTCKSARSDIKRSVLRVHQSHCVVFWGKAVYPHSLALVT